MSDLLDRIEQNLARLARVSLDAALETEARELVDSVPLPENQSTVGSKVRCFLLRARGRLLLGQAREAEADLNKALKLSGGKDADTWVALSEAMWKRNAMKEARDALLSALKVSPKHQGALRQLSRVLRILTTNKDLTAAERGALLEESVARAKEAVGVDPADAESWCVLGIGLVQQTVASGMDPLALQRALSALNNSVRRDESDPDALYNRGVVHRVLGNFGAASADFTRSAELDPVGLSEAKQQARAAAGLVAEFQRRLVGEGFREAPRRHRLPSGRAASISGGPVFEFKPLRDLTAVAPAGDAVGSSGWLPLRVLEHLTSSDQPLVFLCVDGCGDLCLLLVYRLLPTAVKPGAAIYVPVPPCSVHEKTHTLLSDGRSSTVSIKTVIAEPDALLVDGAPIPPSQYQEPVLATRQF